MKEKLTKDEQEAVLFMTYLEEYMKTIKAANVRYDTAREEILSKRPSEFIVRRLRHDTYVENKPFLDKLKGKATLVGQDDTMTDL
jgi:hypothetical protein